MKDWKYIAYLVILVVLLVVLMLSKTKQYDWSITYSHTDKNPYGTYAFTQLLPSVLGNNITNSYQTLYELKDSLVNNENILILCSGFGPGREDTDMLLNHVEKGGHVLISANYYYGSFADTLGLYTSDTFFEGENTFQQNDSTFLHFVSPVMDTTRTFTFQRANINNYISDVDSAAATTLAKNDYSQPVTVRIKRGKGFMVINCTPMVFTNIHLLNGVNHEFAAGLLSYLPKEKTLRTEFYHLGRMETATPLRFILTNEPLRWAYYLTVISLLLFIVFEAKRKQRIIPVIKPLQNTTLEFVATIGNLYYQRSDHKNIAEKKIHFFFDFVRTHYFINTQHRNEAFIIQLTRKSGVPEKTVRGLISIVETVNAKPAISKEELTQLNKAIENFHQKK